MILRKEDFLLATIMLPLGLCLIVLLSTVKAPHEIFTIEEKKAKQKTITKVPIREEVKEEAPLEEALPSLSQSLAAPSPSLGGDLQSLSAGVVSEGNGGNGGLNISQGDSQGLQLVEETGGRSRAPRPVQYVSPTYPQSAQARGIEGFVIIEVVISERGLVTEAKVISAEPQGLFDQVALEAIKKWTFEPGLEHGKTVISRIKQKVNFELN
jgi:protein TonB